MYAIMEYYLQISTKNNIQFFYSTQYSYWDVTLIYGILEENTYGKVETGLKYYFQSIIMRKKEINNYLKDL